MYVTIPQHNWFRESWQKLQFVKFLDFITVISKIIEEAELFADRENRKEVDIFVYRIADVYVYLFIRMKFFFGWLVIFGGNLITKELRNGNEHFLVDRDVWAFGDIFLISCFRQHFLTLFYLTLIILLKVGVHQTGFFLSFPRILSKLFQFSSQILYFIHTRINIRKFIQIVFPNIHQLQTQLRIKFLYYLYSFFLHWRYIIELFLKFLWVELWIMLILFTIWFFLWIWFFLLLFRYFVLFLKGWEELIALVTSHVERTI